MHWELKDKMSMKHFAFTTLIVISVLTSSVGASQPSLHDRVNHQKELENRFVSESLRHISTNVEVDDDEYKRIRRILCSGGFPDQILSDQVMNAAQRSTSGESEVSAAMLAMLIDLVRFAESKLQGLKSEDIIVVGGENGGVSIRGKSHTENAQEAYQAAVADIERSHVWKQVRATVTAAVEHFSTSSEVSISDALRERLTEEWP